MNFRFGLKATAIAAFSLLALVACKKDAQPGTKPQANSHPNFSNTAKFYPPVYVLWGDHVRQVDIGGYYTYSGNDGNVKWDCNSLAVICHVTTLASGVHGNADWINEAQVTALNMLKTDETRHFHDNAIHDGVYTVTTPYQMAIFDNGTETPSSMYTVAAGSYPVEEDDNSFTIIFKDNR